MLLLENLFAIATTGKFGSGQGLNLATAVLLILGLLENWFDNPNRLSTAIGLVIAGVAFALQKVIGSGQRIHH